MSKAPSFITVIVAHDHHRLIGGNNQLLWHLPNDLKRFKALTTGNAIVMGRKTFEGLGRPLPHRLNLVITRQSNWQHPGVTVTSSLAEAIAVASERGFDLVFVVGGGEIYAQALPLADALDITEVDATYTGDTWFPEYLTEPTVWKEISREAHSADETHAHGYSFVRYEKV